MALEGKVLSPTCQQGGVTPSGNLSHSNLLPLYQVTGNTSKSRKFTASTTGSFSLFKRVPYILLLLLFLFVFCLGLFFFEKEDWYKSNSEKKKKKSCRPWLGWIDTWQKARVEPVPKPLVFLLGGKKWIWKLTERKEMLQYDPAGIYHHSCGPAYRDSLSGLTGPQQSASQCACLHRWQTKASQDFQACPKLPCSTCAAVLGLCSLPQAPTIEGLVTAVSGHLLMV